VIEVYLFAADSMRLSVYLRSIFFVVGSEKRIFAIKYALAFQGHPKMIILVPIESVYCPAQARVYGKCVRLPISVSQQRGPVLHRF